MLPFEQPLKATEVAVTLDVTGCVSSSQGIRAESSPGVCGNWGENTGLGLHTSVTSTGLGLHTSVTSTGLGLHTSVTSTGLGLHTSVTSTQPFSGSLPD